MISINENVYIKNNLYRNIAFTNILKIKYTILFSIKLSILLVLFILFNILSRLQKYFRIRNIMNFYHNI